MLSEEGLEEIREDLLFDLLEAELKGFQLGPVPPPGHTLSFGTSGRSTLESGFSPESPGLFGLPLH